ncbi:basic secretory protein-like protein [Pedobacter metabolipauper]|uniref:Basic secretory peptidase family protein n=1 Tax=Pedobacter metabolipauper TaxID=425513 RepID=A0A4R6SSY1_9SPHI|nr:basic secretory protein-like protein [Pedobacter metabolipauper]TDQ07023.1 basic secretory peptidase family protein [Pedobacter metabolipauper]
MNKTTKLIVLTALVTLCGYQSNAQEKETIKRDGLTLNFTSLDSSFDPRLKQRMIETFFTVYPLLKKEYNENAATELNFVIDTAYKGVAATGGGRIVYSPAYFKQHPTDVDVVTHEVMHVIQSYGRGAGPGWLTEGIADYVRYKFGVDNPGAKWALPEYKDTQSYTNSYRITARFLAWLESHGNKGLVKKLDANLRAHTFTAELWKKETGKTLDELWVAYSANPAL